jgi:pimeloyl-ACP methyl ester carboxylesterase
MRTLHPLSLLVLLVTSMADTLPLPTQAPDANAVVLPPPTGKFPVGTTSWRLVDEKRVETYSDGEQRHVQVIAWYPTNNAARGERAPYLRSGFPEVRTFAALRRLPESSFDYVAGTQTSAILDAAPRTNQRFPLLIFSHGYTAIASSYTALLEDLASHGYAVLSIVHPYEAMAATLADGRIVRMVDEKNQIRQGIRAVFGEWAKEDETMAAVTAAATVDEQLALMRGYLTTLKSTNVALDRWVSDTRLVLDRLPTPTSGAGGQLATRLDLSRVGIFGHSMGGVTAAAVCAVDARCKAGLNLDGIPQYGTLIDAKLSQPFLMVYSDRKGRVGASDVIYRRAAARYLRVDMAETLHNDFSDMVLWRGPLATGPMFGAAPPERTIASTRRIVREYFDEVLRGVPSPLLSHKETVAGVRVH